MRLTAFQSVSNVRGRAADGHVSRSCCSATSLAASRPQSERLHPSRSIVATRSAMAESNAWQKVSTALCASSNGTVTRACCTAHRGPAASLPIASQCKLTSEPVRQKYSSGARVRWLNCNCRLYHQAQAPHQSPWVSGSAVLAIRDASASECQPKNRAATSSGTGSGTHGHMPRRSSNSRTTWYSTHRLPPGFAGRAYSSSLPAAVSKHCRPSVNPNQDSERLPGSPQGAISATGRSSKRNCRKPVTSAARLRSPRPRA